MRFLLVVFTGLMLLVTGSAAQANIAITVDKNAQLMTVAVDGVQRYQWPVSTGIPARETPNGTFHAFRMEEDHFSKEFDDAPMPHSIFFTKIGHAIHGTLSEGRLGTPASHGCVRLSRANAATLYALVEKEGVLNTTVTLTGSAAIALARNPRTRLATTRPDPAQPQYDAAAGEPVVLTPQAAPQPQVRPDDGYIYPADGSDTGARYPAPPGSRRTYDAQTYQQQQYYAQQQQQQYYAQQRQQQYYNNPGYAPQPSYGQPIYVPRPYY
jgi:L,D-transpeptidase catalytic domain